MRKKEELEKKVKEALTQPPSKYPLVVDIGRLSGSQSQATNICEIFGLDKSDLVQARWVAVHKKKILDEDPEADYSQVLEKIRKIEELKMDKMSDFKERVEELRKQKRVAELERIDQKETRKRERQKREEEYIREFCEMVIQKFEAALKDFQKSDGSVSFNSTQEFTVEWPSASESSPRRVPSDNEFAKLRQALEDLEFETKDNRRQGLQWMKVTLKSEGYC